MNMKSIAYWVATTLIALETFVGGITDLVHGGTEPIAGPPVVGIVRDGKLLLDCLTLSDDEIDEVAAAVKRCR